MSLRQTNSNLVGLIAFVGLLGNVGCGGESPTPSVDSAATDQASSAGPEVLGEAIGTVRDGKLEFSEMTAPSSGAPGLGTENFGKAFTQSKITFATSAGGPVGQGGTAPCTANQYCADVQVTNNTGVEMDNTFVEVTDYYNIIPAGTPITWGGAAFPLSSAYSNVFVNSSNVAAASYGTLTAGATGSAHWQFNAGVSTNFNFHVKVYASFQRPTMIATLYKAAAAAPAIDACSGANSDGINTFFTSGDDGEVQIVLPFPITMAATTFDHAVVGANGYVLFYNTTGATPSLGPTDSRLPGSGPPGLYPFWDDLGFDADGGVCVSSSGTTPNRLWRVTWKNAKINTNVPQTKPAAWNATNERVTYSLSVSELTDLARYYYPAPTVITTLNQGGSASCGWRGPAPAKGGSGCGSDGVWLPTFPESIQWAEQPTNP